LRINKSRPEPLRYLAHHFAPGDKFRVVVNPWALETCYLFDARGAWVGQARSWQRISQNDIEGLHAQMGRAAQIEKELLAPVAARGRDLTRQRLEATQHNVGVLRGQEKATTATATRTPPPASRRPCYEHSRTPHLRDEFVSFVGSMDSRCSATGTNRADRLRLT
jgi:hypothetical protein